MFRFALRSRAPWSPALVGLALLAPLPAAAGKVVLAPLLADETVNPKQRLGVHQLIASELDFAPEVDGVVDLNAPPPTLNDPCLSSAKCLQGIAAANGGQNVLSGRITGAGDSYTLDLVYFDGTTIARRKAFTVPQDPTSLSNAMTPIVREMLTGASTPQQAATGPKASDFALDDDVALGVAAGGAAVAASIADDPLEDFDAPPPVAAAPPPAPSSKSRGEDRRLAAAGAATGLAVGGIAAGAAAAGASSPPPVPAAPPPADDDLARSLSFSTNAAEITAEQIDAMIQFGPPPGGAPVPAPQPVVRGSSSGGTPDVIAEEEEELQSLSNMPDLDGGTRKPPGGGSGGGGGGGAIDHVLQITARGGYSRYWAFNFFTGGGEVALAAAKGFHLLAGVELYAVQRTLPIDVASQLGIYKEWNYIFPLNLGGMYKFPLGKVQPYIGADTIFVQYYKDEVGADWAVGGRARAGADFMVHPNFGFNLNLAAGVWSGQNWGIIQTGVGQTGFLPQVSAGTVVSF